MKISNTNAAPGFAKVAKLPLAAALGPIALEPKALLESLAASFESTDTAKRWLQTAARTLVEGLGIDRAEFYERASGSSDLQLVSSWPASPHGARLPFERPGGTPWLSARVLETGSFAFDDLDELPREAEIDLDSCRRHAVTSAAIVLLSSAEGPGGILALTAARRTPWSNRPLAAVEAVAQASAAVVRFLRSVAAAEEARRENARLREQIERQSVRRPGPDAHRHPEVVGRSQAILHTLSQVEHVAPTMSTVLLLGETGTGKELVARAIHDASPRSNRPMVRVNCAALPPTLIESELFGREKGAYTGALSRQAGRFELADGSTIFLDEIGELAPDIQVKLLRVLQEGEFERIGSTTTQRVKVRVVAATNRDLAKAVREGRFREDLFYRLNVFPIRVPALRDRREDIPLLVWAFVEEFGRSMGRPVERISSATMEILQSHSWPGNVRELRNVIERAMIVHRGPTLHVEIPEADASDRPAGLKLDDVQRRHILAVLRSTGWRIRGRGGASELLGLKPTTLESRLAKLGIRRPASAAGDHRPHPNP